MRDNFPEPGTPDSDMFLKEQDFRLTRPTPTWKFVSFCLVLALVLMTALGGLAYYSVSTTPLVLQFLLQLR
jgi:hypothetical protein